MPGARGFSPSFIFCVTALSTVTSPSTSRRLSSGSPPGRSRRGGVTRQVDDRRLHAHADRGRRRRCRRSCRPCPRARARAVVQLGRPEVFALGAATGTPAASMMARVTAWSGQRIADGLQPAGRDAAARRASSSAVSSSVGRARSARPACTPRPAHPRSSAQASLRPECAG